jgi:hypothetical protein
MAKDFDLSGTSELPQAFVQWMTKTDSQLSNLATGQQELKEAVDGVDGKMAFSVTERALLQQDMAATKARVTILEERTKGCDSVEKGMENLSSDIRALKSNSKKNNSVNRWQLLLISTVVTMVASVMSAGIVWFLFSILPQLLALIGGGL